MAETYRVRVKPKEYNTIKNLAEDKDMTFAEATEQLIEEKNIIVGNEVVSGIKNMDEEEINKVISDLEEEKEKLKQKDEKESSGVGLVVGSVVAGLIYLLSKGAGKD